MNAIVPIRTPASVEAEALDRRADAALARFNAEWPAERCRTLGDAICGTPDEQAAANAKLVAQALERRADDTLADEAVRALVKGHRAFNQERGA